MMLPGTLARTVLSVAKNHAKQSTNVVSRGYKEIALTKKQVMDMSAEEAYVVFRKRISDLPAPSGSWQVARDRLNSTYNQMLIFSSLFAIATGAIYWNQLEGSWYIPRSQYKTINIENDSVFGYKDKSEDTKYQ